MENKELSKNKYGIEYTKNKKNRKYRKIWQIKTTIFRRIPQSRMYANENK